MGRSTTNSRFLSQRKSCTLSDTLLKCAFVLFASVSVWAETPLGMIAGYDITPAVELRTAMERELATVLKPLGIAPVWFSLEQASKTLYLPPSLIVSFHGFCDPVLRPEYVGSPIALAQSSVSDGVIQPFVAIDCDGVGRILMSDTDANPNVTAGRALARVLAHEVYHVLAQSKLHTGAGITKKVQTAADLTRAIAFFDKTSTLLLKKATGRMILSAPPAAFPTAEYRLEHQPQTELQRTATQP